MALEFSKTDKAITVLRALDQGREVKIEGRRYVQAVDGHDNVHLCCMGVKEDGRTGKTEDVLLIAEMAVGIFIEMCGRLTDDEVFLIGAETVLNDSGLRKID